MVMDLNGQRMEHTDPHTINGETYRYHFGYRELQKQHLGDAYWSRSAFSPHVNAMAAGESIDLEPRAQALAAVFVPLIVGHEAAATT